ncbi:Alpha/beta hydrolase family protein [Amycolatopsis arida]|uniref:Alpha/beta hydrolase family protein n=1 Tax=Amycolatopsis arida TaxID=587909 RepID=A0A1I5YFP6_9PSEU|nr:alpha/beta hydrolase [Amycolatopsis arida]TDX90482.1 alpha/beta hydrolase family protein [Amycolatopsis arida]SFQ43028.1 Alpha/beta hydrolase family protein [Amycolatopsis arida]
MATFVLVPGFWLGAWAWAEVAEALRAHGHDCHPVTLPGLAERAAEGTPETDLATHVDELVGLLEGNDLRDVVLVGHSGANAPVTGAADRVPERLRRLVYVDTAPMPDGMCVADFWEPEYLRAARERVDAEGDGWRLPPPPFDPAEDPEELAGLTDEQLELLRQRATPQPFRTAAEPLRRPGATPVVPTSLIANTITPDEVQAMIDSGSPAFAVLAGVDLHHLPTGHWPMLSRPKDLTDMLDQIAQG